MRVLRVLGVLVLLAGLAGGVALAQGRGRGQGRGREGAPGQVKKAERQAEARFADRDREAARNWYVHARRGPPGGPPGLQGRELPPGLRDRDRLPPGLEGRLQPGFVIEAPYRPEVYPAPVELVRTFPPPPPDYRYVSFGGNVLLIDAAFRIADMINVRIGITR